MTNNTVTTEPFYVPLPPKDAPTKVTGGHPSVSNESVNALCR